jgi:hypothetical protein
MNFRFPITLVTLAFAFLLGPSSPALAQSEKKPTVDELIQELEFAEGHERDVVMDQMDQIHDADVLMPPLLVALDRVDPQNAWKLLDLLARFPAAHAEAQLVRLAKRADSIPRDRDMEPFLVGEPARKELLKALTEVCATWQLPTKNLDEQRVEDLTDEDKEAARTQRFIEWLGSGIGRSGSAGLDQLLALLRDHNGCRQTAARGGLISLILGAGSIDPKLVNGVTAALSDADLRVKLSALTVLEPLIGYGRAPLSKETLPPLFSILKSHPDSEARSSAFAILRSGPGDTAKRTAQVAMHDVDENIQESAYNLLEALSASGPN